MSRRMSQICSRVRLGSDSLVGEGRAGGSMWRFVGSTSTGEGFGELSDSDVDERSRLLRVNGVELLNVTEAR